MRLNLRIFLIMAVLILSVSRLMSQTGPVLRILPDPVDFDTTQCNTTKCVNFSISNVGDSLLTISKIDSLLSAPFQLGETVTLPVNLDPGQSRNIRVCYNPKTAPKLDTLRVYMRANTRLAMQMAFLFDVNSSMSTVFKSSEDTIVRLTVARNIANGIINKLRNSVDLQDESAVFSYEDISNFTPRQAFTSDASLVRAALPTQTPGAQSCTNDALMKTINAMKNLAKKKVIIVFTDGVGTCGSGPIAADVLDSARKYHITVFSVGLNAGSFIELKAITSGTGGTHTDLASLNDISAWINNLFKSLTTNNYVTYLLRGRAVTSSLAFDPPTLDFGIVPVSETRCLPVTLRNTGESPVVISSIDGAAIPFSLKTLPGVILPGGQATLDVCFTPFEFGVKSQTLTFNHNSCSQGPLTYNITGNGSNAPLGPILRVEGTDFDTVQCKTQKCRQITIRNLGDVQMTIYTLDSLIAPPFSFSSPPPVPFPVQPDQTRSFEICYNPQTAPRDDSQIVWVRGDTRVSFSTGLLFDVSGSMSLAMSGSDATKRIDAAKAAGISFVNGLLNTQDIQDEDAVFAFSDNFSVRQGFTNNKTALVNAIQTLAPTGGTGLYNAIISSVNQLAPSTKRKALLVLTDGENNVGTATPADVINAAVAAKVKVFTIGVGEANSGILQQIANSSGGQFFSANSATNLIDVYRQIAALLSKNVTLSYTLHGRAVSPVFTIDSTSLTFDSTKVGDSQCRRIHISNTGDAPLIITNIIQGNGQFAVTPQPQLPLAPIRPGDNIELNICFKPNLLRIQNGSFTFQHNSCSQPDIVLPAKGIGWDSVTIYSNDVVRAKPGSVVNYSIRLKDKLPAEYLVNSAVITMNYNKTMLYVNETVPAVQQNTVSQPLTSLLFSNETFSTTDASPVYTLSGNSISTPLNDSLLIKFNYLVLHGNSLESPVSIKKAVFADGNPKVGIINSARIIADSLCYQSDRLIDATARINSTLIYSIDPNPISGGSVISFRVGEDSPVSIKIFDVNGKELVTLPYGYMKKGDYEATLDLTTLENGIYLCVLESLTQNSSHRIMIIK